MPTTITGENGLSFDNTGTNLTADTVSEAVKELDSKITISTVEPTSGDGDDGDIWFVVEE